MDIRTLLDLHALMAVRLDTAILGVRLSDTVRLQNVQSPWVYYEYFNPDCPQKQPGLFLFPNQLAVGMVVNL
jgi:hypothetical protein